MSMILAIMLQLPTIEQMETKATWTDQDRKAALEWAKVRATLWSACIAASRKQMTKLREPPETIATGVLGSCLPQQKAAHRAIVVSFRGVQEPSERERTADDIVEGWRKDVREAVIGEVLAARSSAAKP
jgi:hypothetical protein